MRARIRTQRHEKGPKPKALPPRWPDDDDDDDDDEEEEDEDGETGGRERGGHSSHVLSLSLSLCLSLSFLKDFLTHRWIKEETGTGEVSL